MSQCTNCKRKIPVEFLSPLVTSEDGTTEVVCGVCGLELMNKFAGDNREKFDGEGAEQMRQNAIRHYKETNQD